jgi:hypothetical protein
MFEYITTSLSTILIITVALFVYVSDLGDKSKLNIDAYITPTIFKVKWIVGLSMAILTLAFVAKNVIPSCYCLSTTLYSISLLMIFKLLWIIVQIINWRTSSASRYQKRK